METLFGTTVEARGAISLWEPWAILWALGEKANETRHWRIPRKYINRTIYIHAAQKWNSELAECCQMVMFRSAFLRHLDVVGPDTPDHVGVSYRHIDIGNGQYIKLPFGCLIGKVKVIGDLPTQEAERESSPDECAFGDYTPGRFAWVGTNHQVLERFIPLRGEQGFFTVKPSPFAADEGEG